MKIDNLPRVTLINAPTPIEELKELSNHLGGPRIFIKRDDLTGMGLGGNKTRKLEYLIGDALQQGCDTLITTGGIQSNHCRLTAVAAVRAGLKCELVLSGSPPEIENGNVLLDRLFGANITWCYGDQRNDKMLDIANQLTAQNKKPYVIPVGGSNEIGAVGYISAMAELKLQLLQMEIIPDYIVFATSSGGTQVGLEIGKNLYQVNTEILGISIDQTKTGDNAFPPILRNIAAKTLDRIQADTKVEALDFSLNCDYLGAGYAIPGELEISAIQLCASLEGILLGPVYTGRAMGGLMDLIQKQFFKPTETILFLHTGGTPELFAYHQIFKK